MEVEKQTSLGRRCVRVALRLAIFAALFAALKVNVHFEGNGLISLLIILAAFFLAFYFTSREWLKIVIVSLAAWFLYFLVFIRPLVRESRVSTAAISPDGRVVAEIFEPGGFMAIDRNFIVRLNREGRYTDYFRSPDEGRPPAESLLWSKDGRYLLLLGTRKTLYTVRNEACLSSGECLYLLVDTDKGVVYANTRDGSNARVFRNSHSIRNPRPFSVDDLSGIDFGESFTLLSQ